MKIRNYLPREGYSTTLEDKRTKERNSGLFNARFTRDSKSHDGASEKRLNTKNIMPIGFLL